MAVAERNLLVVGGFCAVAPPKSTVALHKTRVAWIYFANPFSAE